MITYSWQITMLDCHPSFNGLENVVNCIHWRLVGRDGDVEANVSGSQRIEYDPESDFILFDDLTEEIAVEWLESAIGQGLVSKYKLDVAGRLAIMTAPAVVTIPAPWSN